MNARPLVAAVSLAVVAFGACATEAPPDAGPTSTPERTPEPEPEQASCTNTELSFTVEYPAGWQTNDGEVMPECSVFDPEPIRVQPATEIPEDIAVVITSDEVSFERATAPGPSEREIDRSEGEVDGRKAVRIEAEATGEGLYDAGTLVTRWVVDVEGGILTAHSTNVGQPEYATKQEVLDQMIESLRFT